jgi:hypothetical protein
MSDDEGLKKNAQDAATEFTRMKLREESFMDPILPGIKITNDDLDKQVDTDNNVKIVEKEPESPGAISIPYGTMPKGRLMAGPKYRVMFSRVASEKWEQDVSRLRTYDMDIRQVLSDNSVKDIAAEKDGKFIATINTLLGGADTEVSLTETIQWKTIYGGITRDTVNDALKIMPQTPAHLETKVALINNVTVKELQKWGRDELGGDLSEEVARNGWGEQVLLGVKWIVTIKRDLVPDNTIFMFAEPKYLGKHFILEDITMYVDRKAYMIEFFSYMEFGASIGNVAGIARVDFSSGSSSS